MPIRILMLTAACLAFAARAEAGTTWVGAQLQFPVPASDIGDRQLGVGAGVTLTKMTNTHVGFGADLIYHYWPASTGYESAFDHYLRSTRLEALQGSAWAFTAFQVTGHVKLVAPLGQRYAPWVQIGAGGYRLNSISTSNDRVAPMPGWREVRATSRSRSVATARSVSTSTPPLRWWSALTRRSTTCGPARRALGAGAG